MCIQRRNSLNCGLVSPSFVFGPRTIVSRLPTIKLHGLLLPTANSGQDVILVYFLEAKKSCMIYLSKICESEYIKEAEYG